MGVSVDEAAARLGVDPSRVRQMLRSHQLTGVKVAGAWVVDTGSVARAVGQERPGGRPLTPARAWGLLDLLAGGRAPWLDPPSRSKVRAVTRRLAVASGDRWRAALRVRSLVVECWAAPGALAGMEDAPGHALAAVRIAGPGPGVVEVYVDFEGWMWLQPRVLIGRELRLRPNLIARVPQTVWPFPEYRVPLMARVADDLEHADAQVVEDAAVRLRAAASALA